MGKEAPEWNLRIVGRELHIFHVSMYVGKH